MGSSDQRAGAREGRVSRQLSILGYLAMVAGLLGLILARKLFSPSPAVIIPQAVAVLLMLWARVTFGRRSFHLAANPTAGGLVTAGPYRIIRHPIYTAVCLFTTSGALAHWSWLAVVLGALVIAGALVRISIEEQFLLAEYPEYGEYRAKSWRMLPLLF